MKLLIFLTITLGTLVTGLESVSFKYIKSLILFHGERHTQPAKQREYHEGQNRNPLLNTFSGFYSMVQMWSTKVTKMTGAIDECCSCAALLGGEGEVSFPVLGTVTIKSCLGSYSINNYNVDLMQWHSSVGFFWAWVFLVAFLCMTWDWFAFPILLCWIRAPVLIHTQIPQSRFSR